MKTEHFHQRSTRRKWHTGKRSASFNAKLKHYCTVMHPEALYMINRKGLTSDPDKHLGSGQGKWRVHIGQPRTLHDCGKDAKHVSE